MLESIRNRSKISNRKAGHVSLSLATHLLQVVYEKLGVKPLQSTTWEQPSKQKTQKINQTLTKHAKHNMQNVYMLWMSQWMSPEVQTVVRASGQ